MKLEAKKVSIEFPGVKALSDVDFELNTGEMRTLPGMRMARSASWIGGFTPFALSL